MGLTSTMRSPREAPVVCMTGWSSLVSPPRPAVLAGVVVQPRRDAAAVVGVNEAVGQQLIGGNHGIEGQVVITDRRQQSAELLSDDPSSSRCSTLR